jgi:hypothetical protein
VDHDEMQAMWGAMEEHEKFLSMVSYGVGVTNAGYEVGWTPAKTKKKLKDPEFAQLVADAQEMLAERFEQALYARAQAGNVPALQLVLYSKYGDRGWRPPAQKIQHEGSGKIDLVVVASVAAAVKETISAGHIGELQGPIEDAEIVDP